MPSKIAFLRKLTGLELQEWRIVAETNQQLRFQLPDGGFSHRHLNQPGSRLSSYVLHRKGEVRLYHISYCRNNRPRPWTAVYYDLPESSMVSLVVKQHSRHFEVKSRMLEELLNSA